MSNLSSSRDIGFVSSSYLQVGKCLYDILPVLHWCLHTSVPLRLLHSILKIRHTTYFKFTVAANIHIPSVVYPGAYLRLPACPVECPQLSLSFSLCPFWNNAQTYDFKWFSLTRSSIDRVLRTSCKWKDIPRAFRLWVINDKKSLHRVVWYNTLFVAHPYPQYSLKPLNS